MSQASMKFLVTLLGLLTFIVGGCFTAHNVANAFGGVKDFLDYVKKLPNYQTTIDRSSSAGISISYKKSN